jgi:hypothetical protein
MPGYNLRSTQSLIDLFNKLTPVESLSGIYQPELPGHRFLVPFKWLFLRVTGLPGWKGKQFMGTHALNLITRSNRVVSGPRMDLSIRPSRIDGKQGLAATYGPEAPFMWRHCTDEFRWLDDQTILGMSHFDVIGMRSIKTMFILHHAPDHPGIAA